MKLIFTLIFFSPFFTFCQVLNSTNYSDTIPTKKLIFRVNDTHYSKIQLNYEIIKLFSFNDDSVIVYKTKNENIYLSIGKNNSFRTSEIGISNMDREICGLRQEKLKYSFIVDSLKSKRPYLIAYWSGWNDMENSTYSTCGETRSKYSNYVSGITIISLNEMQIMFQGIDRTNSTITETKYPGNHSEIIENISNRPVLLDINKGVLNLAKLNDENHYIDLIFDYQLSYGWYQIVNDKFKLIKTNANRVDGSARVN